MVRAIESLFQATLLVHFVIAERSEANNRVLWAQHSQLAFKGVHSLLSNSNTLSITVVPGMKPSRKWSCTAAIGLLQDGNAQLITKTKRKIICQPYMGHTHSALAPDAHPFPENPRLDFPVF